MKNLARPNIPNEQQDLGRRDTRAPIRGGYYVNLDNAPPSPDRLVSVVGRGGFAEFDPKHVNNPRQYIADIRQRGIEPIGYFSSAASKDAPGYQQGVTHSRRTLAEYPGQHYPIAGPAFVKYAVDNIQRLAAMGYRCIKLDDIDTIPNSKNASAGQTIKNILDEIERRKVTTPDGKPAGIVWINNNERLTPELARHPRVHGFQVEQERSYHASCEGMQIAKKFAGTNKPGFLIGFSGNGVNQQDLGNFQNDAARMGVPVTGVLAKGKSSSINGEVDARLPFGERALQAVHAFLGGVGDVIGGVVRGVASLMGIETQNPQYQQSARYQDGAASARYSPVSAQVPSTHSPAAVYRVTQIAPKGVNQPPPEQDWKIYLPQKSPQAPQRAPS